MHDRDDTETNDEALSEIDEQEYQRLFSDVSDMAAALVKMSWDTARQCRPHVEWILKTRCRDGALIEKVLDQLLEAGFCEAAGGYYQRLVAYYETFNKESAMFYRSEWYDQYINENTADLEGDGWDD